MAEDDDRRRSATHYTHLTPTPGLMAVVALAAQVTHCPIAMINVIDGTHQYTVAAQGFDTGSLAPIEQSSCAGVIARGAPVIIPDTDTAGTDAMVSGPVRASGFRAYAGVPLLGRGTCQSPPCASSIT